MPNQGVNKVEPLPWWELDSETRRLIESAQRCGAVSETTVPRVWALRPDLARAQLLLQTRFHDSNILPGRLLELIRLRVAALNDCTTCKVSRKSSDVSDEEAICVLSSLPKDEALFSEVERAALEFAETFVLDHASADVTVLQQHFSDPEIVELVMYCALMLGSGRFAFVMRPDVDGTSR